MGRIITLITDFGLADEYAGVMKGVILGRAPTARIVDITHAIPRHDVFRAALLLHSAYSFFPPGSIHLIVVDPGVGSGRRVILLKADGHLFLAPDNGVLSLLLEAGSFEAAYVVQCKQFYLSPISSTFHGRDIMAPVAAQLAAGLAPAEVGPSVLRSSLAALPIPEALVDVANRKITGRVTTVDNFGNLQTNIKAETVENLFNPHKRNRIIVTIKNKYIVGIKKVYAQMDSGELLAVINSRGYLEIAVNKGNAALVLGAGIGVSVTVEEKATP